jgi:hypothetical protein
MCDYWIAELDFRCLVYFLNELLRLRLARNLVLKFLNLVVTQRVAPLSRFLSV